MALTKVTGHVVKPDTNIQFHNTKSTGIVTFAHTDNATSSTTGALQITGGVGIVKDLHVGGNITVGGTLTYDDVTNIDSLGIVTARTDIHLGQSLIHLGDLDTKITFDTNTIKFDTAGGERIRIASDGKVGIGITNPSEKLDVNGTIQCLNELRSKTGNDLLLNAGSVNRDVKIQVNDVNMLYVKGDTGRVGIGSAIPGGVLDLYHATSNTILNVKSGDAGSVINLIDNATRSSIEQNGISLKISSDTVGSYANSDIRMQVDGGTKMMIDHDGYVGINTTNPQDYLHIAGSGQSIRFTGNQIKFNRASSFSYIDQYGTGDLAIRTTPSGSQLNRLVILSGGNIGIGEDAPSEKLQVKGDILLGTTGGDVALKFEYSNHQFAKIVGNGRDSSGYGDIDFYTSTGSGVTNLTQRMTIRADGKVGIGSDLPTQVLDVNGNIRSSVLYLDRHGSPTINMTSTSDTGGGSIYFGSPASGLRGGILYNHDGDVLKLRNIYGTSIEIDNSRKAKFYGDMHMLKGSGQPAATLSLQTHDTANSVAKINLMARDNSNNNETCCIEANSGGGSTVDLIMSTASSGELRISNIGAFTATGSNSGNPIGLTIKNINTATYSHARLRLESENAARYADIWCDKPNEALRLAYNSSNSVYIKSDGKVGINKSSPDSDLHIYRAGGAKLTLETADNADAWINFSGNTNEMSFGFDKSDNAMILANNDGIQSDRRLSISTLGHVNIGQGIASASETVYIRWDNNTANRSYSNGGNEGFVVNTNRYDSSNYEGVVDFVAGRGSDNNNGGTRFRFFAQPRNTGVNRLIMDMNGTKNHVRMGNSCIYSYGNESNGEFGSTSFTHYDYKVGGNVVHNDAEATRARNASGGDGGTGGIGPKQSTLQQSYATPYKYEIITPNHESDSANKYYPVSFQSVGRAGGGMIHTMQVARRYHDDGPSDYGGSTIGWTGSSTHQGGLDLFLQVRDSAWSDMYDMRIMHYRYTYHQTVGGWGMFASYSNTYGSGPFYLMLRGGFKYQVYAAHPMFVANVQPGGRVYSTSYGWYWPASTTSTSGALNNFSTQYYAGTN